MLSLEILDAVIYERMDEKTLNLNSFLLCHIRI